MEINDGSFLEKLVQLIEQSIAPEAVVERNVRLPILGSASGAMAQCDIVIRNGKPPRQTVTIVEVQDREKPVDINTFRGWQQKLQDVGAQHLYCVSRQPFSESIKEKAVLSGNTVKLITLTTLDVDKIPLNFFKRVFMYQHFDIPYARKKAVHFPSLQGDHNRENREIVTHELKQLKTNDLKFSFYPPRLTALSTICIHNVSPEVNLTCETRILRIGFDKPLFFHLSTGEFIPIQLELEFTATAKLIEMPDSILSYDQHDDGALAWVVESFYQSPWGPIWMKMPVTRSGDEFTISGMLVNIPVDMEFNFQLEKRTPGKTQSWKAITKDTSKR